MNRRTFISTLGLAISSAPMPAAAQPRVPRIGILTGASESSTPIFDAFRQGLRDHGHVDGQNLVLEFRFARGQLDRFPALAAELVRLHVDVILTDGGNAAALAARNATQSIPIVMAVSGDP